MEWLQQQFNKTTRTKLQSPNEYCLLLCDRYDSYISAGLVGFCLNNRINLLLLPPHSSHLLQPLDIAVFGPLKTAISAQLTCLLCTGILKLQMAAWLEHFVEAQERAITKDNILTGW
jgi:DDE superfamily endonuclease